jgi:peptidoglycan hydrolase CwlO-like protein
VANRKDKKIQFYQYKIYSCEAELMDLQNKINSFSRRVHDLDKDRSNHKYRLEKKAQKIESEIKKYQQLIEEQKAI